MQGASVTTIHPSHDAIDISDVSISTDMTCRDCHSVDDELYLPCTEKFSPEAWNHQLVEINKHVDVLERLANLTTGKQQVALLITMGRLRGRVADSRIE